MVFEEVREIDLFVLRLKLESTLVGFDEIENHIFFLFIMVMDLLI